MKINKLLALVGVGLLMLVFACSDDDTSIENPFITLVSGDLSIKPDSTTSIAFTITALNGFSQGSLSTSVTGNGSASITEVTGSGSTDGTVEVSFVAGSTPNEDAILVLSVTDDAGLEGELNVDIAITDLDFPVVYVVNEGNFFSANGSVSSYDLRTELLRQSVFEAEATVQNARVIGDELFLVSNAPNKVEALSPDFTVLGVAEEGLDNPIDIAVIENAAYVTNWGNISTAFTENPDSYIAIIELSGYEVIDSIMLMHRPQDILAVGNNLYVTHEAASVMTIVNTEDNTQTTIDTPAGPSEMKLDANGQIVVLCTSGSLLSVDPSSNSVEILASGLSTSGFNEKMALNTTLNRLYFLGSGNSSFTGQTAVYAVDLNTADPVATSFLTGGGALYGIGVNPETQDVYVADNNSFQSTGTAFIYGSDGALKTQFATGVGPNAFILF